LVSSPVVADQPDQSADDRPATGPRTAATVIRGLAVDLTPLRESRDFRVLWLGELVSMIGRQITVVALPFQVFVLTRSPFAVGLIGLAQLVPLIVASIAGGAVADRVDRRTLILVTETGMAASTAMLLLGAVAGHPPLWYLYAATGLQAGISGINLPARSAAVPNLVRKDRLPAALALNQILFNGAMIVGPSIAGILLARFGLTWAYTADLASCIAAIGAAWLLRPLPPKRGSDQPTGTGWSEIREGFAYLRGRKVLLSTFLIDLDAMIFGMPRALFPVLALTVFHVGPKGLGLLYAAPAVGALVGALTTGWVGRIRRQGLAVVWAVVLWGASIAFFGLSGRLFPLALAFLAFAGAADVVSAVFRGTILQLSVPDSLRGRLSAIHIMVVTGGPRLGDVEAGWVASLVSPWFSVVSGGVACVIGAVVLAAFIPQLVRYRRDGEAPEPEPPPHPAGAKA
jgi:MFS family permease